MSFSPTIKNSKETREEIFEKDGKQYLELIFNDFMPLMQNYTMCLLNLVKLLTVENKYSMNSIKDNNRGRLKQRIKEKNQRSREPSRTLKNDSKEIVEKNTNIEKKDLCNNSINTDIASNHTADELSADIPKFESFFCYLDENGTLIPKDNSMTPEAESSGFQCFVLSIDEIKAMGKDTEIKSVHNNNTDTTKAKLLNLKYVKNNTENLIIALKNQTSDEAIQKLREATIQVKELEKEIEDEETKLSNIYKLQDEFKEKLILPKFGNNDKYDPECAYLSCNTFIGKDDKVTLNQFWNKLLCFSETNQLSELAVKQLLSCLLNGPAHSTYVDHKDKGLTVIVQALIDRYGSLLTIEDKLRELDDITRKPSEKLQSIMARISSLIDSTQYFYDPSERESRRKLVLFDKLLNVVEPSIKNKLISERVKAARCGYILDYKQLFNLAKDLENQDGQKDRNMF